MSLYVRLLGEFEAARDENFHQPIEWPRKQTQQLFKLLISQRGEIFSQDQLIDMIFPKLDPQNAIKNLHKRISELRSALEPNRPKGQSSQYVESPSQGNYRFSPETDCRIDIEHFDTLSQQAERLADQGDFTASLKKFDDALEIYRGDYLREDLYEEWAQALRSRLRERHINTLFGYAEALIQLAHNEDAIAICKRIMDEIPGHEDAYALKMRAHYYAGESQKSLATYEQCERALKIELGLTPSPEIHALYIEILNGTLPKLRPAVPNNLPRAMSSFVGRTGALQEIKVLLSQNALLTLSGVGGAGKTRLSQKAAEEMMPEFPDGVWLLELAPLSDPSLIEPSLARVLDIREDQAERVMAKIEEKLSSSQTLLILDNCEHLIEACASLAENLLRKCHNLKILATSREALGITGEIVWAVPSLSVIAADQARSEAEQLFLERAQSHAPEFRPSPSDSTLIADLCAQLDGIPLAIELAAAQLRSLSLQQICERLSDRFVLLGQSTRTALPHHQTLRATMDWSYELLSASEQLFLKRLSVFRGGFTLESAEEICVNENLKQPELIHLLRELINKSLVSLTRSAESNRYSLLGTVRHYAEEKLAESGESETLKRQHLEHYLKLSEESTQEMKRDIEIEEDNVRAALRWAFDGGDVELGAQLLIELRYYWYYRGSISEGFKWFERLGPQLDELPLSTRSWGQLAHAILVITQRDRQPAISLLETAAAGFESLDDKKGLIDTLQIQSAISFEIGEYEKALNLNNIGMKLCKELDDQVQYRTYLHNHGVMLMRTGELEQSRALIEEALQLSKKLESTFGICWAYIDLARFEIHSGELETAEKFLRDAESLAQDHESMPDLADVNFAWGDWAVAKGQYEEAEAYYKKCLRFHADVGSLVEISENLEALAYVNLALNNIESAARMLRAAHHRRTEVQIPITPLDQAAHERALNTIQQALGEADFDLIWEQEPETSLEILVREILQPEEPDQTSN